MSVTYDKISTRDAFGIALLEKAREHKNLYAVGADTTKSMGCKPMLAEFPDRVINNGIANDAGLNPTKDSIYHEDETASDYINIIAVNSEDKDDETLNRIAELYQLEDTKEFIEKEYEGNYIPTFVPLSEIGW